MDQYCAWRCAAVLQVPMRSGIGCDSPSGSGVSGLKLEEGWLSACRQAVCGHAAACSRDSVRQAQKSS